MTLSVWRYAHLALAVVSSLFLIVASLTGIVLAVDAIDEKLPPYRVENFEDLVLADVIPQLQKSYLEVNEISVDHRQFTTLKAFDSDGNDINAFINPESGKILGTPESKSEFIQWTTSLHRSLFLQETGRLIIGVVSFLLMLIALSGAILVIKRQKGLKRFFSTIVKEHFTQYYHIILGRLMLIPIFIIALSGTYLSMVRFQLIPIEQHISAIPLNQGTDKRIEVAAFPIFEQTKLSQVKKIEFPFDSEDPDEFFILKLNDRELQINQFTGAVVSDSPYPYSVILDELSLDLHTGRTNILWAVVLGLASLNILFFIYSGFSMTLRRRVGKIKNKYNSNESRIIILYGSENGSTSRYAVNVQNQLISLGYPTYVTTLNKYRQFPKAEHIIILTSTHGLGDAPSNATKFLSLLDRYPQAQKANVSVVGFGSKSYPDFCGFAKKLYAKIFNREWTNQFLPMHTVDDKSPVDFAEWAKSWGMKANIPLATTSASYVLRPSGLQKMIVVEKTKVSETDHTFMLTLRPQKKVQYSSGDLLAIYPMDDARERFYSIGTHNGCIQLVVKLHENGLGSQYLYTLEPGSVIQARVNVNSDFHFPKSSSAVALIANGTGIAPFLGMIEENTHKTECHLFCGFRNETESVRKYKSFAANQISSQHLQRFEIAFSREQNQCYVVHLIQNDARFFANLLRDGGTVMICGSLAMQIDVEKVLEKICIDEKAKPIAYYKTNGQLLTDCY